MWSFVHEQSLDDDDCLLLNATDEANMLTAWYINECAYLAVFLNKGPNRPDSCFKENLFNFLMLVVLIGCELFWKKLSLA